MDALRLLLVGERQRGNNCLTVSVTPTDHLPVHHPMSFLFYIEPPRIIRSEVATKPNPLSQQFENGCSSLFQNRNLGKAGVSLSRYDN